MRSYFCFCTRLALISAGSPIHSSKPNSASSRSNQREYPCLNAYPHGDSSLLQVSIALEAAQCVIFVERLLSLFVLLLCGSVGRAQRR